MQFLAPLHTYPDGNSTNAALHMSAIARHLDAEVHAVVFVDDFPAVKQSLGNTILDAAALVAGAKEKCHARAQELIRAVTREMEASSVSFRTSQVECLVGTAERAVVNLSRYHDLTIVCMDSSDLIHQATAQAVIFESGRPVILVPEQAQVTTPDHVLIAWDGSRFAARAVADARDFLQRARSVSLVAVTDEKALPSEDILVQLTRSLERHGIKASFARIARNGRSVGQALQEHGRDLGATLLVMGGFAHSRLRDFFLGGATNGVLTDLKMPVLLSH